MGSKQIESQMFTHSSPIIGGYWELANVALKFQQILSVTQVIVIKDYYGLCISTIWTNLRQFFIRICLSSTSLIGYILSLVGFKFDTYLDLIKS